MLHNIDTKIENDGKKKIKQTKIYTRFKLQWHVILREEGRDCLYFLTDVLERQSELDWRENK